MGSINRPSASGRFKPIDSALETFLNDTRFKHFEKPFIAIVGVASKDYIKSDDQETIRSNLITISNIICGVKIEKEDEDTKPNTIQIEPIINNELKEDSELEIDEDPEQDQESLRSFFKENCLNHVIMSEPIELKRINESSHQPSASIKEIEDQEIKEFIKKGFDEKDCLNFYQKISFKKRCHLCRQDFTSPSFLMYHSPCIYQGSAIFNHKCPLCPERKETLAQVRDHLETDHLKRPKYECLICGHKTVDMNQSVGHLNAEHNQNSGYLCSYNECNVSGFTDYDSCFNHIKNDHLIASKILPEEPIEDPKAAIIAAKRRSKCRQHDMSNMRRKPKAMCPVLGCPINSRGLDSWQELKTHAMTVHKITLDINVCRSSWQKRVRYRCPDNSCVCNPKIMRDIRRHINAYHPQMDLETVDYPSLRVVNGYKVSSVPQTSNSVDVNQDPDSIDDEDSQLVMDETNHDQEPMEEEDNQVELLITG